MFNEHNILRKYVNYVPRKATVLLKCTNPEAYIKAKEFEEDKKKNRKF